MFALKPDKIKNKDDKKGGKSNKNFTLDTKHREMVNKFQQDKLDLPKFKQDLEKASKEHDELINQNKEDLSSDDYNRLKDLKDTMKTLRKKIKRIETKKDYTKYMLKSSDILFAYYQSRDNVDVFGDNNNYDDGQTNTNNSENIFNFLVVNPQNDTSNNDTANNDDENNVDNGNGNGDGNGDGNGNGNGDGNGDGNGVANKENGGNDDKRHKYSSNRASLLNKFMVLNDKSYVQSKTKKRVNDKCSNCNAEVMIMQTEGKIVCEHCGVEEDVIINSDKPSFREPPSELTYFAYKRINHFNETLAQIQAKESTEIPDEVFDKIRNEIRRERISNMKKLNKKMIKKYLNRLGYNKYYEHAPFIIQKLSGKQLYIPRELEEQAKLMFRMAEEEFPKIKPADRKNFLNYNYMHYKIFEMLGYHDIKKNFPLLKGKQKLHLQDQMLHDIAERLKTKFPPGNVWENFVYTDDF